MNRTLVTSLIFEDPDDEKYNSTIDIYYPPGFRFNRKLPVVVAGYGIPDWKSSISTAQLIASTGVIVFYPHMGFPFHLIEEHFGKYLDFCEEIADEYLMDLETMGVYISGHSSPFAVNEVIERLNKDPYCIKAVVLDTAVISNKCLEPQGTWKTPFFFIHGEYDNYPDVSEKGPVLAEKIKSAGSPVQYEIVQGGAHNWATDRNPVNPDDIEYARQALEEIADFFKKNL